MHKLLREPLLHFLLLGIGIFVLHRWVVGPGGGLEQRVVITQGRIEQLAAGFAAMHQRRPAADELEDLIASAVREEILYREAKSLGLDQDDTIVRRRLAQKLEFVSEDVGVLAEPTDAQLQAFLDAHPAPFRIEASYSFTQLCLDPRQAVLLPAHFDRIGAAELSRLFGARFEASLRRLPSGRWQAPVASAYGLHRVLLERRDEARQPALAEVREQVRREWLRSAREQENARYYADLRSRYEVIVERASMREGREVALASGSTP